MKIALVVRIGGFWVELIPIISKPKLKINYV